MSINPSSDLVLDVIKAGDPTRAEAVNERLETLASASGSDEAGFVQALQDSKPVLSAADSAAAAGARARLPGLNSSDAMKRYKENQARINFEASVLNTFMQDLMPKDSSDVYGQGTAGDMWRSMLGDQIARQIAKSGVLGISQKLFATHGVLHDKHPGGERGSGSSATAQDSLVSQNALSLPNNVTPAGDTYLFLPRKPS